MGKALQNDYREKVKLATKMPSWMITSQEDMKRIFQERARVSLVHKSFTQHFNA